MMQFVVLAALIACSQAAPTTLLAAAPAAVSSVAYAPSATYAHSSITYTAPTARILAAPAAVATVHAAPAVLAARPVIAAAPAIVATRPVLAAQPALIATAPRILTTHVAAPAYVSHVAAAPTLIGSTVYGSPVLPLIKKK